jgi:CubicO group peptidase (beta-lactamase class C family)
MLISVLLLAAPLWLQQAPATAPPEKAPQVLAADTPTTTTAGNRFIAPVGWKIDVNGSATILEAPEPGSRIALIDVEAKNADEALKKAWAAFPPRQKWPLKITNDFPDKDGWTNIRDYTYLTSPNEKRSVYATTRRAGKSWTVALYDLDQGVEEKRLAQIALITSRLLPKGYERESFAGKKANTLDPARLAKLAHFVDQGRKTLGIPAVSVGILQNGKVVFADGFGETELGNKRKPDADTLYIIASNTKALTTLMLGKLLDEGKMTWQTPVTSLLPSFKLGNEETTRQVLVKHLICACTGLPRQDYEWLFQYKGVTPEGAMQTLATIQPTTKFGELFQYSNSLAAAAGFVGGHVAYPDLELGAAYDKAMQSRVFDPLGMTATTFDFNKALNNPNHSAAHAPDIDGHTAEAVMDVNWAAIPVRPAAGAWSNVRDMLKYVQMELDEGTLPDGKRYIARDTLLERRKKQVQIGQDVTYGMGLTVDTKYGIPVVHHGGDMIGQHSDMIWIPDAKVGAVILTGGDPGWLLRGIFRRKLLEVLYDGRAEADADIVAQGKSFFDQLAADRKLLTVPAPAADTARLARHYSNPALGEITVTKSGTTPTFDFGEWKSEVAPRHNPDGTLSFITTVPGMNGFEFVVGAGPKPNLIVRDAQHEYIFTADDTTAAH